MKKLTAGLFITLDGVIQDPDTWSFAYQHPRIGQFIGATMGAADCMLIGRATYDGFAPYWPHQSGPMADVMNGTPKYVVSNTLETAEWQNCTIVRGDVAQEVTRLKQGTGRNIGITGSGTLVASLLRAGLIDELSLIVVPIVLGRGKRLFETPGDGVTLELASSEAVDNGVLLLTYRPAAVTAADASAGSGRAPEALTVA